MLAAGAEIAGGEHFRQVEELVAALIAELTPDTVVLVKGSRFMRMERVIEAIAKPSEQKEEKTPCC